MADDKPIIVIKKKGGHGGHHGGAWKIAYADFVTAMMAFFMVMWLVNSASTPTKQAIASYFRKPGVFQEGSGTPLLLGGAGILEDAYVPPHADDKKATAGQNQSPMKHKGGETEGNPKKRVKDKGEESEIYEAAKKESGLQKSEEKNLVIPKLKIKEKTEILKQLAEEIKKEILATPELKELLGELDVKIDSDGLNIEIMDTEKTSMFKSGSSVILPEARAAFQKLTQIIMRVPNTIDIVGHTDAKPFGQRTGGYSNWELSVDRANAARRVMEGEGIPPERFNSVVGRAAQDLKKKDDPFNASNRRITLKMRFKFTSNLDLSKNPNALDEAKEEAEKYEPDPDDPFGDIPAGPKREEEVVHSLTAKEVLKVTKDKKKEFVQVPESDGESPPSPAPAQKPQDFIFDDNPVVGPSELFRGF